jgi:hypothetical protein
VGVVDRSETGTLNRIQREDPGESFTSKFGCRMKILLVHLGVTVFIFSLFKQHTIGTFGGLALALIGYLLLRAEDSEP